MPGRTSATSSLIRPTPGIFSPSSRVATLSNADALSLTFLASDSYRQQLENTAAAAVVLRPADADVAPCAALLSACSETRTDDEALRREARLHPVGLLMVRQSLVRALVNRLDRSVTR